MMAGYPWFTDWGRDTMIALSGLTLPTGRAEIARGILHEFAKHVDQGMLPNRFPDGNEAPEFNTVDATLWFFEAVRAYLEHTGDEKFVREELYGVLKDIIDWHVRGTRYNIRMLENGLLECRGAGRAVDLDGRPRRRLGGYAPVWQAGGDSGPLVQRAQDNGRPGDPLWRQRRGEALPHQFSAGAMDFQPNVLE